MFSSSTNPYDEIVGECLYHSRGSAVCLKLGRVEWARATSRKDPSSPSPGKATDENLASEDWGLNIEVCDKVGSDGPTG